MPYPVIENFLKKTIGLDPESVGRRLIERAIRECMKAAKAKDADEYLGILSRSPKDRQQLINQVIVPETWFFRDQEPFVYLQKWILRNRSREANDPRYKILSVPCASGEEPFSIAMSLLDAGFTESDVVIEAIDISDRAIEKARSGVFGKNSFRGKSLEYRKKYFDKIDGGYQLHEQVLRLVNVRHGNILDAAFNLNYPFYDAVFCRNLLIYMTQEARKRLIERLSGVLKEGGLFFVGHTEVMLLQSFCGFDPIRRARVFGCRKTGVDQQRDPRQQAAKSVGPKSAQPFSISFPLATCRSKAPVRQKKPVALQRTEKSPAKSPASSLDRVRSLGDRGRIKEALSLCEKVLRQDSLNSEAYFLKGVLEEAQNEPYLAEESFLKALYLNPNHYEALVKLYLLYERKGEREKASVYRERASRVQAMSREGECRWEV